ncbi:F0F1 ATP synthase subunit delta [Microbacterium caowuchunii]|uniref:ATP synthase subunit delta n=1 Tax=Microbacterium caowuchunii TaxID=2614638 RepID=A0A5N0T5H0_9MICO|nr:F0F1 ATP synthase subunit delta [Microbacterium caowuchunii]KAA9130028.1 F0F1 ATP synthase subunit delta [Microbacterium caowuchunii]
MGSATTQALSVTNAALGAASGIDLTVASELFQAARAVGASSHLSAALADFPAPAEARAKVVADVFGPVFAPVTVELLTTVTQQRWSSVADLVDGIEELAVRAASVAAPDGDLGAELFRFFRTVAENPELELALGSRVGDSAAKSQLVASLLEGRESGAAVLVISSLVRQTRGRRVRDILTRAMAIVGDQRSQLIATVVTASELTPAQSDRLTATLSQRYGADIALNIVIDPSIVGGLRVQIADDVIDASVSARLADLRQRLAG